MIAFWLGKTIWSLTRPSTFLLLVAVCGLVALWVGRRGLAKGLLTFGIGVMVLVTILPVGLWLTVPLENRFPRPADPPADVAGIVVLGGPGDIEVTKARSSPAFADSMERVAALVQFANRFPNAKLVFSGGSVEARSDDWTESTVVAAYLREQGVPEGRVTFESGSRTTDQNARLTYELIQPKPGERWLLVTSAKHMPRAIGVFRRVGWTDIEPWPVDYRTVGEVRYGLNTDPSMRLHELDEAAYEWLGLLYYWTLGRTEALFPAPREPLR